LKTTLIKLGKSKIYNYYVPGLFGSSSIEAFLIDELLEVIMELFVKQVTPVFVEQDLEKKVRL